MRNRAQVCIRAFALQPTAALDRAQRHLINERFLLPDQRTVFIMALAIQRTVACDRCGQPASQSFGEGGRGWYESFLCPSCGQAYEADGFTPAPDEFRKLIIAREGEWALEVTTKPSLTLLKALRRQFSLSLNGTAELKAGLPGEVRRGTRFEMEQLCRILQASEPGSVVVRPATGP